MKIIKDKNEIEKYKKELKTDQIFSSASLPFYVCNYEPGELLSSPLSNQKQELLFLISGNAKIYGLKEDARFIPINLMQRGTLIGDMEYVTGQNRLFSEAITPVVCLALSIKENRAILDNDLLFQRFLTRTLAEKVYLGQGGDSIDLTVEDRVLYYMTNTCQYQTLQGVEKAAVQLRCSSRQLLRALRKLCEEGKIKRVKKGVYTLNQGKSMDTVNRRVRSVGSPHSFLG